ncbi:DUF4064 domain-containing protein [Bacillus sp. FSL K6-3431]|uniref:DUF4064 domain-containing protein n=1 Tax=Bacillus sp. FSL K6-3431 TaxID=2921500 RepID=UPI0030FCBDDD
MKRTVEFVLGIIGVVLSALTILFASLIKWAGNSAEFKSTLLEDPELVSLFEAEGQGSINDMFSILTGFGTALMVVAIIGIIFGLVGVISIKGNKKPKLAGTMFILGAVLVGIISLGTGFLPALLYLIAGIMCFARKPSVETSEPTQY